MPFKHILLLGTLFTLISCGPSLRQAEDQIEKNNYPKAEKILEQLLNSEPNNTNAKVLLGLAQFYTQSPEQGLSKLKLIHKKKPHQQTLKRILKQIRAEYTQLDQVLSGTPKELKSYLSKPHPPFFRDRAHWRLIQKIKTSQPKEAAQALMALQEQTKEQSLIELIEWEKRKTQPAQLEELLIKFPKSELRSIWFTHLIDYYKAEENKSKVNELYSQFKQEAPTQGLKAEILLQQASYNLDSNPIAALNYYKTYLKNHPDHPQGRKVIYKIREKLQSDLSSSDHVFLANMAYKRYMYQTASSELTYESATHPQALLKHGEYALKAKYKRQAQVFFQRLSQGYPGSTEAGKAKVYLAQIQRNNKNYYPAIQALNQIQTQYSQNAEVRALALWETGLNFDLLDKNSQRISAFQQLLNIDPTSSKAPQALWHVIWNHYLNQDYENVLTQLQTYEKSFQGNELEPRFLYWKARCLEHLEKWKAAKEIYANLSQGLLMDYYTHRAKERLKVINKGGEDLYATQKYKGMKATPKLKLPSYEDLFDGLLNDKRKNLKLPILEELVYLKEYKSFKEIAPFLDAPQYKYWNGIFSQKKNSHYKQVSTYRYLAYKDNLFIPLAFPLAFFDRIQSEAKKYKMNPFLVSGLIWQESQYKPDIKSWVGATGLMQIMPSTAEQIAKDLPLDQYELTEANDNIQMGTWYLNFTHEKFKGNSLFAVASYNAGTGPVYRWQKQFKGLPLDALAESITYPETREYVKKVFTSYWIYQELYGKP